MATHVPPNFLEVVQLFDRAGGTLGKREVDELYDLIGDWTGEDCMAMANYYRLAARD